MSDQQRQAPQQVVYRAVEAGALRRFRIDNPEARATSWPSHTTGPLIYGFYVPVDSSAVS